MASSDFRKKNVTGDMHESAMFCAIYDVAEGPLSHTILEDGVSSFKFMMLVISVWVVLCSERTDGGTS